MEIHTFVIMIYKTTITISTTVEEGKKYRIFESQQGYIGEATFLNKDEDEFIFDIQLSNQRKPEDFEYKFDQDIDTHELISLRATLISEGD